MALSREIDEEGTKTVSFFVVRTKWSLIRRSVPNQLLPLAQDGIDNGAE